MEAQCMEINFFQSDLKKHNLSNLSTTSMDFTWKMPLVRRISSGKLPTPING